MRLSYVAIAYLGTGIVAGLLAPPESWAGLIAIGLPFGLVSGWILAETVPAKLLLAAADTAVWVGAYHLAATLSDPPNGLAAFLIAGAAGAVGIQMIPALRMPALRSVRHWGIAALLGCVCALPFHFWLRKETGPFAKGFLILGFCCWQVIVGGHRWRACQTNSSVSG